MVLLFTPLKNSSFVFSSFTALEQVISSPINVSFKKLISKDYFQEIRHYFIEFEPVKKQDNFECCICYETNIDVFIIPFECRNDNHCIHKSCFDKYRNFKKSNIVCPICRTKIISS